MPPSPPFHASLPLTGSSLSSVFKACAEGEYSVLNLALVAIAFLFLSLRVRSFRGYCAKCSKPC